MNRYDLEDAIQASHQTTIDLELLYEYSGDADMPMTEDELANTILGLAMISKMRDWKLWDCYIRKEKLDKYATPEKMAYREALVKGMIDAVRAAQQTKKPKKKKKK
jgi:hypothetical protein